jgi:hypothetical protein
MAATRCTTCKQILAQCTCLPPPPPDTSGRALQLWRDRQTVCAWLGGQAGQQDPHVRAWVDADLQRARDADEPTIQAMLVQYGIRARRRQGTGHYPTAAQFLEDVGPIIRHCRQTRKHPSLPRVAALLPFHISERQLRRIVQVFFDLRWEQFLHIHFPPRI